MSQISESAAKSSQSRTEAERIYAERRPLSREQAAELLKAKGWVIGPDGKPVWKPKA